MTRRSDSDLRADVNRELELDPSVDARHINVQAAAGVVMLDGSVADTAQKAAAAAAAHRVAGVLDVANELHVRAAPARHDGEIAAAVRRAMESEAGVSSERISTTVVDGVVTLEGEVGVGAEREEIELAVRGLAGVREVDNRISVRARPPLADDVRRAVMAALGRHAAREAEHLEMAVAGNTVRLSGRIGSRAEKELVIGAALGIEGVRAVEDQLIVGT